MRRGETETKKRANIKGRKSQGRKWEGREERDGAKARGERRGAKVIMTLVR